MRPKKTLGRRRHPTDPDFDRQPRPRFFKARAGLFLCGKSLYGGYNAFRFCQQNLRSARDVEEFPMNNDKVTLDGIAKGLAAKAAANPDDQRLRRAAAMLKPDSTSREMLANDLGMAADLRLLEKLLK
jgi:hypothetical protein